MKKIILLVLVLVVAGNVVAWNPNPLYNPYEIIWNYLANVSTSWVDGTGQVTTNVSVGIGIENPQEKLDVNGIVKTSNGYYVGDTLMMCVPHPRIPRANTITTVDSTEGFGVVGHFSSITIGTDGLPVIGYCYVNQDLRVMKCGNQACSSGNTITTVDNAGSVGWHTLITIGIDGLPVIGYYDWFLGDLKVVKCGNQACSSGNTITTVDSGGSSGDYSSVSITIGTDGLPVISYYDTTNEDLKVAKCGNQACSSGNTITTVDSTGNVGLYTSITIGIDGLPIISYYDDTNGNLKVAKCGNQACSSGNTITTVDSTEYMVGISTSITIGIDGLPIISYYDDYTNDDLRVLKCGNQACSSGNTITVVDSAGDVGLGTSITIGVDGLPVVSYYDNTNGNLKVLKCGNQACSSGNTIIVVDSAGDVGKSTSITIGTDGLPVISYYDQTNLDLKVAKCGSEKCLNYWTRR